MADFKVRSLLFPTVYKLAYSDYLLILRPYTDSSIPCLQSALASPPQLYAFAEKRRKNILMRIMITARSGRKACAWERAILEVIRTIYEAVHLKLA
jgi:hypothetical protein